MNVDLNEYKQIPNSYHYINKYGKILNKKLVEVKPRNVNGYYMLSITKNKIRKEVYVHRIVATLFLENQKQLICLVE